MAKSEKQKLKLLYIVKILWDETDESHPISMSALIERLKAYEISAERKSIYNDMACLDTFGFDIGYDSSHKTGGYFLASRDFELPELKILVDMVQASRFLSEKKSRQLIDKLENLTSKQYAKEMHRDVYVSGRAKSKNEQVYYGVDSIHQAINQNKSISFQYLDYNGGKKLTPRHNGMIYQASPYYLIWNAENYYLVAYDELKDDIRHYRVDRMQKIEIADRSRQGKEHFDKFDIAEYTNATFGMFGGDTIKVKLVCHNQLANVVIDRFGDGISLRKLDEEHFTITPDIVPSKQFYGWVAGIGKQMKIAEPERIKQEYCDYLKELLNDY